MKKFLINIVNFSLCIILINFIFYEIKYRKYLMRYERLNEECSFFLLSDSHGLALGKLMEEYGCFNFSAGSDSCPDMLRKVDFLIKHTAVETIIIQLDDHSLSPYRDRFNNLDRSEYFSGWRELNDISDTVKGCFNRYFVMTDPKARDIIKSFLQSYIHNSESETAFDWMKLKNQERNDLCLKRFKEQLNYDGVSEIQSTALHEIMTVCERNNIELVGIKFPLPNEYISVIGDINFGADKLFEEKNLKIYDFKYIFLDREDCFYNQDHLNSKGGKELVKIIYDCILEKNNSCQYSR